MRRTLAAARGIADEWVRRNGLKGCLKVLIEQGRIDLAISTTRAEDAGRLLNFTCFWLIQGGHTEAALRIVGDIEDSEDRHFCLSELLRSMEEADDPRVGAVREALLAVSLDVLPDRDRRRVLTVTAEALWRGGDPRASHLLDEALDIAHRIDDPNERRQALTSIGFTLTETGQAERGLELLERYAGPKELSQHLLRIGEQLRATGEADADRFIDRAVAAAEAIAPESGERGRTLRDIAQGFAADGQLDRALAIVERTRTSEERSLCLKSIAETIIRSGDPGTAALADSLMEEVDKASSWPWSCRGGIAHDLARAGHLQKALEVLEGIADLAERCEQLSATAVKLLDRHRDDPNGTLALEQALTMFAQIRRPAARARALPQLLMALRMAGRWDEALALTRTVRGRKERALEVFHTVTGMAAARQVDRALATLRFIPVRNERRNALRWIASHLIESGDTERALRLPGLPDRESYRRRAVLDSMDAVQPDDPEATAKLDRIWREVMDAPDSFWLFLFRGYRQEGCLARLAVTLTRVGYLDRALTVLRGHSADSLDIGKVFHALRQSRHGSRMIEQIVDLFAQEDALEELARGLIDTRSDPTDRLHSRWRKAWRAAAKQHPALADAVQRMDAPT